MFTTVPGELLGTTTSYRAQGKTLGVTRREESISELKIWKSYKKPGKSHSYKSIIQKASFLYVDY